MGMIIRLVAIGSLLALSGCGIPSKYINPFHPEETAESMLGDRNDHALDDSKNQVDSARNALNAMASYQGAQSPQPYNPVIRPSIVRLMWVPDHLNRHGDLVPAHYYYLKVKSDEWAVTDAFELEAQLNQGQDNSSNVPYVTGK